MALIFRRRPRRRELLYFGLGIFILNLAVSYYYSSKRHWVETGLYGPTEESFISDMPEDKEKRKLKEQNHNARRNFIDAMPISIDVKNYKVRTKMMSK